MKPLLCTLSLRVHGLFILKSIQRKQNMISSSTCVGLDISKMLHLSFSQFLEKICMFNVFSSRVSYGQGDPLIQLIPVAAVHLLCTQPPYGVPLAPVARGYTIIGPGEENMTVSVLAIRIRLLHRHCAFGIMY